RQTYAAPTSSNPKLPARLGTATLSAATTTAAAEGGFRPRFVDRQTAAAELVFVQLVDGLFRIRVRPHFDEPEAARAAGRLIAHHGHLFDRSRASEQLLQFGFSRFVRKVSHIQLTTHDLLLRHMSRYPPWTLGWTSSRV